MKVQVPACNAKGARGAPSGAPATQNEPDGPQMLRLPRKPKRRPMESIVARLDGPIVTVILFAHGKLAAVEKQRLPSAASKPTAQVAAPGADLSEEGNSRNWLRAGVCTGKRATGLVASLGIRFADILC